MEIVPATTDEQLAAARALIEEYGRTLGVDAAEELVVRDLAEFPGPYAPPRGALLLAYVDGRAVGCVALRPWRDDICEMKRLYVQPAGRGLGIGKELAVRIIDAARRAGYRAMRLDTLGSMQAAMELYRALGFDDIEPYTEKPLPTARHMELRLRQGRRY